MLSCPALFSIQCLSVYTCRHQSITLCAYIYQKTDTCICRQAHTHTYRHVYSCSPTQCHCTWSEFRKGLHVPVWNALPVLFPHFAVNIPDSALSTFLTCLCCVGMAEEVLKVFSSFLSILALMALSQHRLSASVSPLPSHSSFPPCFVSQTA